MSGTQTLVLFRVGALVCRWRTSERHGLAVSTLPLHPFKETNLFVGYLFCRRAQGPSAATLRVWGPRLSQKVLFLVVQSLPWLPEAEDKLDNL